MLHFVGASACVSDKWRARGSNPATAVFALRCSHIHAGDGRRVFCQTRSCRLWDRSAGGHSCSRGLRPKPIFLWLDYVGRPTLFSVSVLWWLVAENVIGSHVSPAKHSSRWLPFNRQMKGGRVASPVQSVHNSKTDTHPHRKCPSRVQCQVMTAVAWWRYKNRRHRWLHLRHTSPSHPPSVCTVATLAMLVRKQFWGCGK